MRQRNIIDANAYAVVPLTLWQNRRLTRIKECLTKAAAATAPTPMPAVAPDVSHESDDESEGERIGEVEEEGFAENDGNNEEDREDVVEGDDEAENVGCDKLGDGVLLITENEVRGRISENEDVVDEADAEAEGVMPILSKTVKRPCVATSPLLPRSWI